MNAPRVPPVADLARRFDACIRLHGSPPPLPTERSVRAIEEHFGITLPATLLALAKTATSFGGWFASLGEDFTSPTHIIRLNSYWRRRRKTRAIPRNLVIINLGFDEDLDCLDIGHGCGGD